MHVLSVTSEFFPLIKTGGLADVAGALPSALAAERVEMRTLLPGYPAVLEGLTNVTRITSLNDLFGGPASLLAAEALDRSPLIVIDAPHLYDRPGNPYIGADGKDRPDNDVRYAALSWIGAEIAKGLISDYRPDVVHGHDWQAGLTPVYLFGIDARPRTVLTIHNLAFQGIFPATRLAALKLPAEGYTLDGFEFWGKISFLKGGIRYADHITTVSPTYAQEICTITGGMGLDGLLRERRADLSGITNGIDPWVWDPANDPHIEQTYGSRSVHLRARNKAALQKRFGLDVDPDALLFCAITRLTSQKGFDIVLQALPTLLENGGQLALLGSGETALETAFADAARDHPGRVAAEFGYDEPLSHQMQAGADAILIPSRFEPCGLTQLYGLRYGCLPIVARVGGLADTVIDANQAALTDRVATGFQFAPDSAPELRTALERAFALYADRKSWQQVQRRGMSRKVNWSVPAKLYAGLYSRLCSASPTAA